jgi:excisionase family DNA binding protein
MSRDSSVGDGNSPATSVAPALEGFPAVPDIPRSSQEALYTTAVTPEEVARQLAISRARVYELMATRELPSFRIGRSRRVWLVDLVDYIRRRRLAEEAEQ